MPTYYRSGKVTPVNMIGIKSNVSYFRNADAAVSSITALDEVPTEVLYGVPHQVQDEHYSHGPLVYFTHTARIVPGTLSIPPHPMKSGKLWQYAMGSQANSSTYKHTITVSNVLPYAVFHCEMEHATTSKSVRYDLLGPACERAVMIWGDEEVAMHNFDFMISKHVTANDIARPTDLDTKGNFMAGAHTTTLTYNATSTATDIIHGEVHVANTVRQIKSGDTYVSDAIWVKKDFDIYLDAYLYDKTAIEIPTKVESLAGAMTLSAKIYRTATTDYCNWSFTNLRLAEPIHARLIDQGEYILKARIHLKPAGKRTALSENKTTLVFVDDLSGGLY